MRTEPRVTKYEDLNAYLDGVAPEWQQMLIDVRELIANGNRMKAWFEATYIQRNAHHMVEHSTGDMQEVARRLLRAAEYLTDLAKDPHRH